MKPNPLNFVIARWNHHRKWVPLVLAGLFAAINVQPAAGDVIVYDQSTIDGGGHLANISSHRTTEQFILDNDATVIGFNVFLAELGQFTIEGVFEGFTGLGWAVYAGSGNNPTTLQASGSVLPGEGTLTDTFVNNVNNDVFRFDFDIPALNLSAGEYWLAMVEPDWGEPHDGVAIAWYGTAGGNNQFNKDATYRQELFNKNLGNSFSSVYHTGLAFQVRASAVPEPGTCGAMFAAMAGWFLRRRRRSRF